MTILTRFLRWLRYHDGVHDFTVDGSMAGYLLANARGETKECPKLKRKLAKARKHLDRQRAEQKGDVISIKKRRQA